LNSSDVQTCDTSGIDANQARPAINPITPASIAKLQSHDGSFRFDARLIGLLYSVNPSITSLEGLRLTLQSDVSLNERSRSSTVWATILVAAVMRKRMLETKDVWAEMWAKAKEYVVDEVEGGESVFLYMLDLLEWFV
jgi:hypothetical protein